MAAIVMMLQTSSMGRREKGDCSLADSLLYALKFGWIQAMSALIAYMREALNTH